MGFFVTGASGQRRSSIESRAALASIRSTQNEVIAVGIGSDLDEGKFVAFPAAPARKVQR
jgi:hypothetical protein